MSFEIWKRQTKLDTLAFDMNLFTYFCIEDYLCESLSAVGVNYKDLNDSCASALMIGVFFALAMAKAKGVAEWKDCDKDFPKRYAGFLHNTIMSFLFDDIYAYLTESTSDEQANKLRDKLIDEFGFSDYDAYLTNLVIGVLSWIDGECSAHRYHYLDNAKRDDIETALFKFYSKAKIAFEIKE